MSKFTVGLTIGVLAAVAAYGVNLWIQTRKTCSLVDELVKGFDEIQADFKKNNLTLRAALQRYELLLNGIKTRVRITAPDPEEMEVWLDRIAESHRNILEIMSHY